jgi:hypothetical protein
MQIIRKFQHKKKEPPSATKLLLIGHERRFHFWQVEKIQVQSLGMDIT